jgi:hypothetical protein
MSNDTDLVIGPGGPRQRSTVRAVAPGEVVRETAPGTHVVEPAPAEGAPAQPALDQEYVLTPGGYRRRSQVHLLEGGALVDMADFHVRSLHPSGAVLADFGHLEVRSDEHPLQPGSIVHPPTLVPAFGTGWITDAGWSNNTGSPITSFSTTWVVPPAPTTQSNQVIFLFNGIQNSTMIYQPVLQWGVSAAGGGPYWAVASWYADGQTGTSFHTNLTRVNPGDVLVGLMKQTGHSPAGFNYTCEFVGIANTTLPVQNVQELTWANETLEAYRITQVSDYPDEFRTAMRAINLTTAAGHPTISWSAQNRVTDCGQHTVIVSNDTSNGEVDLCYSAEPVSRAQGLAASGTHLYAAWKGETGDDRLFFSASADGSSWAPQQAIGGNTRVGPSLATFNGRLYAAWKGMHGDQRLFFMSFDGSTWTAQQQIPGVASRVGPSLAACNGRLYAAWRGMDSDEAIWFASFDGAHWSAQARIPGVASSTGPALAVFNGRLFAAWKGMRNDQAIWYSSFDGLAWAPQRNIPGVASSIGPSLAAFNGRLYAAWKGMGSDQAIWYSSFDGGTWAGQATVPGVATSEGPALAAFGNRLFALWKGMNADQRLFFSSFNGTAWAAQRVLAGNTGPDL